MEADARPDRFADRLASLTISINLPGYLSDLARLEWLLFKTKTAGDDPGRQGPDITINPTLTILPVRWKNLPELVRPTATEVTLENEPAHVLVWRHPKSGCCTFGTPKPSTCWH